MEQRQRHCRPRAWLGPWKISFPFLLAVLVLTPAWSVAGGAKGCDQASSLVGQGQLPFLQDDLDYQWLQAAIDRSLHYLSRLPPEKRFSLCGMEHPVGRMITSLQAFRRIIDDHPSPEVLNKRISQGFSICRATGSDTRGSMLVTGYFEPRSLASLTRTETFRFPLYRPPPDLKPMTGRGATGGRLQDGKVVPYWTRAEIEQRNLLAGHELVWLADPVEVFILHVQGSGRVVLPDGTERRVQFAAKNGREYRSIGRLLVERGVMSLSEVTLPRIVDYLRSHPEEQQEILHHNESFVFFRWGDDSATSPQGCLAEPLTPGRSVALDQACFPAGALGFLISQKPVRNRGGEITGWQPMARFVLNQDTGSAIQGPGRLDLFLGAGSEAETTAGVLKHPGSLYFLLQ